MVSRTKDDNDPQQFVPKYRPDAQFLRQFGLFALSSSASIATFNQFNASPDYQQQKWLRLEPTSVGVIIDRRFAFRAQRDLDLNLHAPAPQPQSLPEHALQSLLAPQQAPKQSQQQQPLAPQQAPQLQAQPNPSVPRQNAAELQALLVLGSTRKAQRPELGVPANATRPQQQAHALGHIHKPQALQINPLAKPGKASNQLDRVG